MSVCDYGWGKDKTTSKCPHGKALDAEMSAWQRSYEVLITWCKEWVAIGNNVKSKWLAAQNHVLNLVELLFCEWGMDQIYYGKEMVLGLHLRLSCGNRLHINKGSPSPRRIYISSQSRSLVSISRQPTSRRLLADDGVAPLDAGVTGPWTHGTMYYLRMINA